MKKMTPKPRTTLTYEWDTKRGKTSETLLNQQIAAKSHAYEFGADPQDITNWQWPF